MSRRRVRFKLPRRKLPLRSRHLKLAKSKRDEKSLAFFKEHTLEELEDLAWDEIKRNKYRVVYRDQDQGGMVLLATVYLNKNFKDRALIDRVALLWHEIRHCRQWRRGLMARYIDDRWRWALEVQAYRQGYKVYLAHGVSRKRIQQLVDRLPKKFDSKLYLIDTVPMRDLQLKTSECIMEHLDD